MDVVEVNGGLLFIETGFMGSTGRSCPYSRFPEDGCWMRVPPICGCEELCPRPGGGASTERAKVAAKRAIAITPTWRVRLLRLRYMPNRLVNMKSGITEVPQLATSRL